MTEIETFGFIAALLTSMAYLPQAVMIIRTGVTAGISLLMYSMLTGGKILWLSYGLLVTSWPLILSQTFTLCLALIILGLTLRNHFSVPRRDSVQGQLA